MTEATLDEFADDQRARANVVRLSIAQALTGANSAVIFATGAYTVGGWPQLDRSFRIQRVFVEGGPTLASSFLRAGLVDEVLVYIAPTLLGGDRLATGDLGVGTIGAQRRLVVDAWQGLGDDLLVVAHPEPHRSAEHGGPAHREDQAHREDRSTEGEV